ncbi:NUDIX hydrolase [Pelagibacterium lentulum]|nr:NUDIX domain-containing protein [Pelagibacterium lentulum]
MLVGKVCPVVLRADDDISHLLVFRHPRAGVQLVKGTIEAGELVTAAALRELHEEAGIAAVQAVRVLGTSTAIAAGQHWHFVIVHADNLPERWIHRCADDGGHDFAFFWHRLDAEPDRDWHPIFLAALHYVRDALRR